MTTLEPTGHIDTFARENLPAPSLWPEMDYTVLPELAAYPRRINVAAELLGRHHERGLSDQPALRFEDVTWTYAELDAQANRIASLLVAEEGLVAGNRVLLRGGNHPQLVAAWYAVLKAGGIPIATMPVLRERELVHILDKARVQFALGDHRLAEDLEAAGASSASLRSIIYWGADTPESLEQRAARQSETFRSVDTAADDVAIIGFTSGSTGTPKGTVHFHRDLLAAADCFIGHVAGIRAGDIVCGSPQIAFLYGLCAFLVDTPRFGATSVLSERATPRSLLETIDQHRATVCFSTPSGYKQMLAHADEHDLSSLRVCIAGGEPLAPAVFDAWQARTGVPILNGLGISELLHIFIASAGDAIRPGRIGRAVPGFRVRVVDEQLRDVAPGEVGEMIVKGPNGCRYLDDIDRQRAYVREGWNCSGDLCRMDEAGYIEYVSRSDDMIVTSGYNVAGPEVEAALLEHPAVGQCAVVGIPDEDRGSIVKAFVLPEAGHAPGDPLARELQDFVKGRIAAFKYPRVVEFVTELPLTATGKVRRGALREREEAGARS